MVVFAGIPILVAFVVVVELYLVLPVSLNHDLGCLVVWLNLNLRSIIIVVES